MHALIFWGFLILSLCTSETFGKGLFAGSFALPLLDGNPSFLLSLDAFTVLVIGAVLVAAFRRLVVRPARLTLSGGAYLILGLIFSLMVTDLLADASRMAIAPQAADGGAPARPGP